MTGRGWKSRSGGGFNKEGRMESVLEEARVISARLVMKKATFGRGRWPSV